MSEPSEYNVVYLQADGSYVCGFKAEFDAVPYLDYGTHKEAIETWWTDKE